MQLRKLVPRQRIKGIVRILGVSALGLWLACVGLFLHYAATRPRSPRPDEGRVYSINNHGVYAYLNQSENMWLWLLAATAVGMFIVAALIDRMGRRDG